MLYSILRQGPHTHKQLKCTHTQKDDDISRTVGKKRLLHYPNSSFNLILQKIIYEKDHRHSDREL